MVPKSNEATSDCMRGAEKWWVGSRVELDGVAMERISDTHLSDIMADHAQWNRDGGFGR